MNYQEKQSIVNIVSGLLITTVYATILYKRQMDGSIDLTSDYRDWGVIFLIFIGVSIIARIIINIIFHILNAIATREQDVPVRDERDKIVELKAIRNSYYIFSISIALCVVSLAIGMPVYGIFIAFVGIGLLSEIVENISQIYYYRKGI